MIYWLVYGLWCLTPLSIIFQLYRGGQYCWWRNDLLIVTLQRTHLRNTFKRFKELTLEIHLSTTQSATDNSRKLHNECLFV